MSDAQNKVGTYELKNCIASGKTTQIWEVTENGTLSFAMKLMLEDARKKPEEKAILKHEFKVGKSFDHPSVIRFHKIEVSRDHAFFIMDFFRAPSMKVQIATNLPDVQSRFARIAESICTAMTHVHEKGWLHRDIKPENILVNKTGETRVVDFSLASKIAKGLGKLVGGKSKIIQGTRTYIAPEVIMRKHVDERTDIYSLGVTLFELATGVPPFAGLDPNDLLKKHLSEAPAPPSAINSNVTPELDQVLLKMIAKKPSDRYADMREVQTALKAVRCFKEDPAELYGRSIREAKEQETLSVDKRLDSRADADRTAMGVAAPAKPTKGKRKTAAIGKLDPVVKKGAPAGHPGQQQPGMPQPMMAPPMMMPPMMMPQPMMMPPMMMPPGAMPPGAMPPGAMPPGMTPPQMPQPAMPSGGMPPQMPAPVTPQVGAPQMPVPDQIQAPPPNSPTPEQATSASTQENDAKNESDQAVRSIRLPLERPKARGHMSDADEDLDFMTELPDIM